MDNVNICIVLDKNGADENLKLLISRSQSIMIRELIENKSTDQLVDFFSHLVDADGIEHNIDLYNIKGFEISL